MLHRYPTSDLLVEEGHEGDLHSLFLAIHDRSDEFAVHGVGDSKDDLGDVFGLHQGGQIPVGADDGQPFENLALLSWVVVNVAHQLVVRPQVFSDSLGDSLT